MKFLIILNWTLWSALLLALLYALVAILSEGRTSPEAGPALGVFFVGAGLVFSAGTGGLVYWLTQRKSVTGLIILSLILAWPLVPLVARPIVMAFKDWKYNQGKNTTDGLSGS